MREMETLRSIHGDSPRQNLRKVRELGLDKDKHKGQTLRMATVIPAGTGLALQDNWAKCSVVQITVVCSYQNTREGHYGRLFKWTGKNTCATMFATGCLRTA